MTSARRPEENIRSYCATLHCAAVTACLAISTRRGRSVGTALRIFMLLRLRTSLGTRVAAPVQRLSIKTVCVRARFKSSGGPQRLLRTVIDSVYYEDLCRP